MATTSLQSIRQTRLRRHHHHHHHSSSFPYNTDSSLSLKSTTATSQKLFANISSSTPTPVTTTPSTSSSPSSSSSSFDLLASHLAAADFRKADEETRRLLIVLAGEAAQKRGYVFFSEVQFIADSDLQAIDRLWLDHSGGRFGYSVQRRIWEKSRRDFTTFFIRVRWMKQLDTEIEQYNYRAFPTEFVWELTQDTPLGHLPLTNALRGTQLLGSILTHPAFQSAAEEAEESPVVAAADVQKPKPTRISSGFKTDYSF